MCGIFGWNLKDPTPEQRTILATYLADQNDQRGRDAWGRVVWRVAGAQVIPDVHKGLGFAADNIDKLCGHNYLMAHTRLGTVGAKDKVGNAHPFTFKSKKQGFSIVGVHNGSVSNHAELNKKLGGKSFEVDSMHIFHHLMQDKDLSDLNGYGAIGWLDTRQPGNMYMSRLTAGGSLALFKLKDGKGLVWSSDKDHLKRAVRRAGFSMAVSYALDAGDVIFTTLDEQEAFTLPDKKLKFNTNAPAISESYDWRDFQGGMTGRGYIGGWSGGDYTPDNFPSCKEDVPLDPPVGEHDNFNYAKCHCKAQTRPSHSDVMTRLVEPLFKGKVRGTPIEADRVAEGHNSTGFMDCSPCNDREKHYEWAYKYLGKHMPAWATDPAKVTVVNQDVRPTPPISIVRGAVRHSKKGNQLVEFTDEDARLFPEVAMVKEKLGRLPKNEQEFASILGTIDEKTRVTKRGEMLSAVVATKAVKHTHPEWAKCNCGNFNDHSEWTKGLNAAMNQIAQDAARTVKELEEAVKDKSRLPGWSEMGEVKLSGTGE